MNQMKGMTMINGSKAGIPIFIILTVREIELADL